MDCQMNVSGIEIRKLTYCVDHNGVRYFSPSFYKEQSWIDAHTNVMMISNDWNYKANFNPVYSQPAIAFSSTDFFLTSEYKNILPTPPSPNVPKSTICCDSGHQHRFASLR